MTGEPGSAPLRPRGDQLDEDLGAVADRQGHTRHGGSLRALRRPRDGAGHGGGWPRRADIALLDVGHDAGTSTACVVSMRSCQPLVRLRLCWCTAPVRSRQETVADTGLPPAAPSPKKTSKLRFPLWPPPPSSWAICTRPSAVVIFTWAPYAGVPATCPPAGVVPAAGRYRRSPRKFPLPGLSLW